MFPFWIDSFGGIFAQIAAAFIAVTACLLALADNACW